MTYCGPATATFTLKGKTYRVRGGRYDSGSEWYVQIGKQTIGGKPRFNFFSIHGAMRRAGTIRGPVADVQVPGLHYWFPREPTHAR